ncbi:unnamed protein product, partial [Ixodes hexagonus]
MSYSALYDPLLLDALSWQEIEDLLHGEEEARRSVSESGLLNITRMPGETFKGLFRFEKHDLDQMLHRLKMPAEVLRAQRVRVPGVEALCMTLRRLAYPNTLLALELLFGRHVSVISSVVSTVMSHIDYYFFHLLADMTTHRWLTLPKLELFSEAVHATGAPLKNCWGFIDGTARRICRPSLLQQEHFSGHKRFHVLKYQAVMCANGIICQLDGPFRGRRHDGGILRESNLYDNLEKLCQGHKFVIYGDPAYPLRPLLLKPYGGSSLRPHEAHFNRVMSTVRQAVEWGFGKVAGDFAFVDYHK